MFFDEGKIRKVNLGDKKVTKKDEFLKKLKVDKSKEEEKQKVAESNKIISKFFSRNKIKIINAQIFSRCEKNLKSLSILLNSASTQIIGNNNL